MLVASCYPTPIDDPPLDRVFARQLLDAIPGYGLRTDFDYRRGLDDARATIDTVGNRPLVPIVSIGRELVAPRPVDELLAYVDRLADEARHAFCFEIDNEPVTIPEHRIEAWDYLNIAMAIARVVNGRVPIALAADAIKSDGELNSLNVGWWTWIVQHENLDPALWSYAAIHPYRTTPPDRSKGFFSRDREWAKLEEFAAGKPLIVTEFGWDATRVGIDAETVASYIPIELSMYRRRGIPLACLYAHTGPEYGVLDAATRQLTPQGIAVREWIERNAPT